MTDKLKLQGIFSQGYGIIPKAAMKDVELSIEAKAIYAYISSYAGSGNTAFPSISLICNDLNISEKRFQRHKKQLEDKGYITTTRERKEIGFSNNIYTINHTVPVQNVPIQPVTVQNVPLQSVPVGNVREQNDRTNNNSLNNNIFNNNKINKDNNDNGPGTEISNHQKTENQKQKNEEPKPQDSKLVHRFYQENINAMETPFIAQELEYWVEDLSVELVLEALRRAVKYNAEYGYAERIMKEWAKKNIDTLEKVKQADAAFEQKNNKRYNNSYNKPKREEKIPEVLKNLNNAKEVDSSADAAINDGSGSAEGLARVQKMRERLQNVSKEGEADASTS